MKREIEYLITSGGQVFEPCKKGESNNDECSIKHLGRQIYLIGFFDFYKQGFCSAHQNKINKYMILFPNDIKRVIFK